MGATATIEVRTRPSSAGLRRRVEGALRGGVATVVQPIVDLDTGTVVGVESLARFSDQRGPEDWFADAAAAGLRIELEVAAARAGLARLPELPPHAYLTVNVSPEAASSGALAEALALAPGRRIVLEITEHAPVRDYEALVAALAKLRDRGVRIAIDDAGAGFASMAHVLRLRPEVIKLDISLTRGIEGDPQRRALVRALVEFARSTSCTIVAEGIETAAQLSTLRALGVECGQGFHLGVPGPMPSGWRIPVKRARRMRARSLRRTPRHGRAVRMARPAAMMIAAALVWPGFSAVAGLMGSHRPAAVKPQVASTAPAAVRAPAIAAPAKVPQRPAAVVRPAVSRLAVHPPAHLPVVKPTATPACSLLAGAVCETVDVTKSLLGSATQLVQQTVHALDSTLGGLVKGLLGHH